MMTPTSCGEAVAILSIQSAVAYGHVGNSAAVFPLQRLGHEVWPIDTVQFSNHTGYGAFRGRVWDPGTIAEIVRGIGERGAFRSCEAVLSGYLGEVALGEIVLDAVAAAKAANPAALYCCDPVIGDDLSGVFVGPGIAEFFRDHALPAADIATPNCFELGLLAGTAIAGPHDALAAARQLGRRGPRLLLVTSLAGPVNGQIAMLAVTEEQAWLTATPRLPISVDGAGDLTAALFLGNYLRNRDAAAALAATTASVFAMIDATERSGERELQLITAQDALVAPPRRFAVTPFP